MTAINYLIWILLAFPPASIAQDVAKANHGGRLFDTTVYQDVQTNHFVNITSNNDNFIKLLGLNNQSVIHNLNNVPLTNAHFLNSDIFGNISTILYNNADSTTESERNKSLRKNDSITLIQIEIVDEKVNISNVNIYNVNSTVINNERINSSDGIDKNILVSNGDNIEKFNSSTDNGREVFKNNSDDVESFNPSTDNDKDILLGNVESLNSSAGEILVNSDGEIEKFNPSTDNVKDILLDNVASLNSSAGNADEILVNSDGDIENFNSSTDNIKENEKYQEESIKRNNEITTKSPKEEISENDLVIVTPSKEVSETEEQEEKETTTELKMEDKQDKEWSEEVTQYDDEYKTTIIFTNLYSPSDGVAQLSPEINLDKPGEQEEKETEKIYLSSDLKEVTTEDDMKSHQTVMKSDEGDKTDKGSEDTEDENRDIDKELIKISEANALKIEKARDLLVKNSLNQLADVKHEGNSKVDDEENFSERIVSESNLSAINEAEGNENFEDDDVHNALNNGSYTPDGEVINGHMNNSPTEENIERIHDHFSKDADVEVQTRQSYKDSNNERGVPQNVQTINNENRRTTEGPVIHIIDHIINNTNHEPIGEKNKEHNIGYEDGKNSQQEQSFNESVKTDHENSTTEKFKGSIDENLSKVSPNTASPVALRIPQRKDIRALIEEKRRASQRRIPTFRLINNQTRYSRDQSKPVNKVIQRLIANRDPPDSSVPLERSEDIDTYALESKTRRSWGGCARECGETTMTCRYELTLEWFHTMSKACYSCPSNQTDCFRPHCIPADGVKRTIAVINRSLPGPLIQVCEGDTIVAKVTNHMMEATTTIHWHGQHQLHTPYMDGVPSVTQCPIQPGASFTYSFPATQPGTHFYHSHSGVQRGDGAFGALIVRRAQAKERHRWTYDRDLPEHTLTILDWSHRLGLQTFTHHHLAGGSNKPDTVLVNGRGIVGNLALPPASFTVTKGLRYRFRLINAGVLNCPIRISIDDHRLTIIASDGNDIQPYIVDWLVTYAGERWDFVLEANADVDNYWMRFIGLMDCDQRFTSAHQGAVLHYSNASLALPSGTLAYNASSTSPRLERPPKVLNELNAGMSDGTTLVHQLNGLARPQPWLATRQPDRKIVLAYDFNPLDNEYFHKSTMYGFSQVIDLKGKIYTPQLNHISLRLPPFPLLTQSNRMTRNMLCSNMDQSVCQQTYCECTNIIEINLGDVVEVILIDQGFVYDANHPFHLHGHSFYVVGMDRLGSNVTSEKVLELDSLGQIKRNLGTPPLKDTVTVPDGGYTIFRFLANNPGYWLLHCHIDFHVEVGMAVVLHVGEEKDLPPIPIGFPTCGDFDSTSVKLNNSQEIVEDEKDNRVESSMVRLVDPTVSPSFGSRWKYNTSSSYSVTTPSSLYTAVCLLAILLAST